MNLTGSVRNLPCSRALVTVCVKGDTAVKAKLPEGTRDDARADTVLDLSVEDGWTSFAGSIDDLLDFGTSIIHAVYGWMILSGHEDWLGDQRIADYTKGLVSEHEHNGQGAGARERRSGAEGAGNLRVVAPDKPGA